MNETRDALRARIKILYPELSATMQRVAKIALDDPMEITLQPLRSVAARSGAGTTTLIRFARLLGFETYGAFRDSFRSDLRRGATNYSERGKALLKSGSGSLLEELFATARAELDKSLQANAPAAFDAFADRLTHAGRIYVVGLRSAYAPAFYFHYLLAFVRPGVHLVENRFGMLPEEIRDAGHGDVAVAISFEPYAQATIETARLLKEAGAHVLAISDSSASPLAGIADQILEVSTESPSFYISFTPLTCILEAVAALVAVRAGDRGVATLEAGDTARAKRRIYWTRDDGREPTTTTKRRRKP